MSRFKPAFKPTIKPNKIDYFKTQIIKPKTETIIEPPIVEPIVEPPIVELIIEPEPIKEPDLPEITEIYPTQQPIEITENPQIAELKRRRSREKFQLLVQQIILNKKKQEIDGWVI